MTLDQIRRLLLEHVRTGGSELYFTSGQSPRATTATGLVTVGSTIDGDRLQEFFVTVATPAQRDRLDQAGTATLTIDLAGVRLRAAFFHTATGLAANFHRLTERMPDPRTLGLPEAMLALTEATAGVVLVTGPQHSGKSTAIAGLIAHIGRSRCEHVVTIEDPIARVLGAGQGACSQLEIGRDVPTYEQGLRLAIDLCPSILVARDPPFSAFEWVLDAAEAGILVLVSIATHDVAALLVEIARTLSPSDPRAVFPTLERLARGVVFQCLLPDGHGQGRHATREVYRPRPAGDPAADDEGRGLPLPALERQTPTIEAQLLDLVQQRRVAVEDALHAAPDRAAFADAIERLDPGIDLLYERRIAPT